MAAGPSLLLVLMTLLTGNGTDLLDYLPTQDYWQAKSVTVSTRGLLDELQPPKAGADISKLIAAMGAGNAAARDEAAKKIAAMGPGVIPQLQRAAKIDDPEISLRAKQLIQQINQSQKAAQVRRLMAIRTLGETRAREALSALQGLAKSEEPFVADYAAAAVAAIEGKPYERPHAKSGADAWLVPEGCRLVAHLSARGGGPVDFDAAMKGAGAFGGPPPPPVPPGAGPGAPGGGPAGGPDVAAMRKQIVAQTLAIAEKTGNIRFDGATVGLSGEIGAPGGYVVAIVHAQYDAAAVAELIGSGGAGMKVESKAVNGTTIYQPSKEVSLAFPSNDRAFLVGGPAEQPLPIEEVESAVRTNAGKLKNVESMAKLIKSVDVELPLWGVAEMTPAYKQAPVLAPFDTIKLTGQPAKAADGKGDKVDFTLEATGKDANQVGQAVAQVNQGINQAKAELTQAAQHVPPGFGPMLQTATEVVNSIQCAPDPADGKTARLTGTAPMTSPGMVLMFFGGVARAEPMPPPAAPAVQQQRAVAVPAQPEPQRKP
jgi:hypothetical protein